MSIWTPKSFWNSINDIPPNSNSKTIDELKISSVNPAPIVFPTQVDLDSNVIGSNNLENKIYQNDIETNGQFTSNHYWLLTDFHSTDFAKFQGRAYNIRNQKYPGFRSKRHFRRKISRQSHTWSDAASSISSSSGPFHSRAATDEEKSPVNSCPQSIDCLSVENIPRLSLKSNYHRLTQMTVDGKNNHDFDQKNCCNKMPVNNKSSQFVSRSLLLEEETLKQLDSKSDSKCSKKSELTTLAPCKGRINLTIIYQFSRMTILLKEADNLRSINNSVSNSFIRIYLVSNLPNEQKIQLFETEIFPNTSCPIFDKSFSFDVTHQDYYKRIVFSTYHVQNNELEFMGCMSFGIKKFQTKTQVSGWYYLLTEAIGCRKHLKAGFFSMHKINSNSNFISTDSNISNASNSNITYQIIEVKLVKGLRGFGFTLCGGSPVYVSQVDPDSSADLAGIHPGDMIIKIDNFNVSQSSTETVVRMFRMCPKSVKVSLTRSSIHLSYRPFPVVSMSMHNSKTYPCFHSQIIQRDSSLNLTAENRYSGYGPQNENIQKTKLESKPMQCTSQVSNTDSIITPVGLKTSQSMNIGLFDTSELEKTSIFYSNNLAQLAPTEGSSNSHKIGISGTEIVKRLQYQGHLKKVDFNQISTNLELYGSVSLKEGNCLFPVQMYLFSQVLLVGQHEPDGYITIIKEPIYCSKICYANIPAFSYDEIILQYINEVGRRQFIYFQAANIKEWLSRIQRHMIYHCNSWMSNVA